MRSVVAAACLLLLVGRVDAALPSAPIDVLVPAAVHEGERVTLRMTLAARARPERPDEPLEIHVVQLPLAVRPLRYLGPQDWRDAPVAYRTTLAELAARPVAAAWEEPGPPGWVSLLVTFSAAGAGPGTRLGWRYAPRLVTIYVRPRPPAPFPLALALGLGTLALVAIAIVIREHGGV